MSLRVLLVNDRIGGLQAAYGRLAGDPSIDVVGRAQSGPEAFRKMRELEPDLVLMELTLPEDPALAAFGEPTSDPESRRVVAMALGDKYFRVAAGRVQGGVVTEPFGDRALQLIARLFMTGGTQTAAAVEPARPAVEREKARVKDRSPRARAAKAMNEVLSARQAGLNAWHADRNHPAAAAGSGDPGGASEREPGLRWPTLPGQPEPSA